MFANGFSSSPSNTPAPFDGPAFPAIAIRDNVEAARRLLTAELGVTHLVAVVGFSMGAQQAFQWAVSHPDFVSAICGLLWHREDLPTRHRAARRRDQRADRRCGFC